MQINNLTNDLELVWSATDKETIPKLGLRTRIAGDFVHLIMAAGDQYSQQPTLKINYNDVTSPVVATVEELRDAILGFAVSVGGTFGENGMMLIDDAVAHTDKGGRIQIREDGTIISAWTDENDVNLVAAFGIGSKQLFISDPELVIPNGKLNKSIKLQQGSIWMSGVTV